MKATGWYRLLTVATLILFAAGCAKLREMAEAEDNFDPSTITSAASVINYITERGISLIDDGPFTAPQLTVPGRAFTPTSGGMLAVFDFPNDADALASLSWIENRRQTSDYNLERQLYRKDAIVAAYWGSDPRIERALERTLGDRVE